MSNDLPPLEQVDLDCNAVFDLHLALRRWSIPKNALWMSELPASRVARNPMEYLSRAWAAPEVEEDLVATIIRTYSTGHHSFQ